MKLDHVAIWAVDIELMRTFYEKYFDARSSSLGTHTWVWSWALGPPSTPLQNDCRATGTRFSMGQDGRATDTTRAWSRTLKATGSLSPSESPAAQPGR